MNLGICQSESRGGADNVVLWSIDDSLEEVHLEVGVGRKCVVGRSLDVEAELGLAGTEAQRTILDLRGVVRCLQERLRAAQIVLIPVKVCGNESTDNDFPFTVSRNLDLDGNRSTYRCNHRDTAKHDRLQAVLHCASAPYRGSEMSVH